MWSSKLPSSVVVRCTKNLFGGFALGVVADGEQKVLVRGAIAGEVVKVRILGQKKGLLKAVVETVDSASPHRIHDAQAPLQGYQFVDYGHQLTIKREIVVDALRRAKVSFSQSEMMKIWPSKYEGHRMRARFHADAKTGRLGFLEPNSHVVNLAPIDMEMLLPETQRIVSSLPPLVGQVAMLENLSGSQRVFWCMSEQKPLPNGLDLACTILHGQSCRPLLNASKNDGRVSDGENTVVRSVDSFFQSNRYLLPELVGCVVRLVGKSPGTVLDLYSGCGVFAQALAADGKVIAVEHLSKDLKLNAARFDFEAVLSTCEDYLRSSHCKQSDPSVVVVDPVRAGLSPVVVGQLNAMKSVQKIVYVSCDVATLARDVKLLEEGSGFRLMHVECFDMFPQTTHVEVVTLLEK